MIEIYYSKKGTPYLWASDLHKQLEIQTPLSMWFPRMIDYGFVENQDFSRHNKIVMTANNMEKEKFDWAVQIDMAKHIAMIQRTEQGKALRQYLLNLDKKVQEGLLLSHVQMSALFDICKVLGFFTVQIFFEQEHFAMKDKPKDWWQYRAKLFGYSKKDLQSMLAALGKRYLSQRQALINLDKYELVRIATMDMFLAMGKSEDYAKNVAAFAKSIAKEIRPEIYDDRDDTPIDFKSIETKERIKEIKQYK